MASGATGLGLLWHATPPVLALQSLVACAAVGATALAIALLRLDG